MAKIAKKRYNNDNVNKYTGSRDDDDSSFKNLECITCSGTIRVDRDLHRYWALAHGDWGIRYCWHWVVTGTPWGCLRFR